MATRKRTVKPLDPQKLRRKKPSEYSERDRAEAAWRDEIERDVNAAMADENHRNKILFVAIGLAIKHPQFARELADTMESIIKAQTPFDKFLRRVAGKPETN